MYNIINISCSNKFVLLKKKMLNEYLIFNLLFYTINYIRPVIKSVQTDGKTNLLNVYN